MKDLEGNKKKDLDNPIPVHTRALQSSGGIGAVESPDITLVQDSIDVSELESLGASELESVLIQSEAEQMG